MDTQEADKEVIEMNKVIGRALVGWAQDYEAIGVSNYFIDGVISIEAEKNVKEIINEFIKEYEEVKIHKVYWDYELTENDHHQYTVNTKWSLNNNNEEE